MTTIDLDFTAGADGEVLTASEAGISTVIGADATTLRYDATHALSGSLSCRVATGGTVTSPWFGVDLTASTLRFRIPMWLTAHPPSNWDFLQLLTLSPTTNRARLRMTSTGTVAILNNSTPAATSTLAVPTGQWAQLVGQITMSTAGAGTADVTCYDAAGAEVFTVSATGMTHTSDTITQIRSPLAVTSMANFPATWLDRVAFSDTDTLTRYTEAPPGPPSTPTGVTVTPAETTADVAWTSDPTATSHTLEWEATS